MKILLFFLLFCLTIKASNLEGTWEQVEPSSIGDGMYQKINYKFGFERAEISIQSYKKRIIKKDKKLVKVIEMSGDYKITSSSYFEDKKEIHEIEIKYKSIIKLPKIKLLKLIINKDKMELYENNVFKGKFKKLAKNMGVLSCFTGK
jgi:hypothetical protein